MILSKGLSEEAAAYLRSIRRLNARATAIRHRTTLYRFYRWMSEKGLNYTDIKPEKLTEYHQWCHTSDGLTQSTSDVELYNARTFICWLIRKGRLTGKTTEYFRYSLKPAPLPPFTHLFLKHRSLESKYAPARYRQLMNLFHNWLMDHGLEVKSLSRKDVLLFLTFLGERGYTPNQLHIRRLHMRIYLDWLRDRDLTMVDCRDIFQTDEQFRNFDLPDFANEYLKELETTLRGKTILSYSTGFKNFHRFLHRNQIDVRKLTRDDCVRWMKYMFDKKKYSKSTRLGRLVNLRSYLSWLVEHGVLNAVVDNLIRSSDFPKLDEILPKPLPPEIDLEIQRRLAASDNMYHKGALLLRFTGMRIGELSNLNFNPIWRDDSGRTYLKVPLGKLNNERLVPIDETTIELIHFIQKASLPHLKMCSPEPEKGKLMLGPKGGAALHNIYRYFKDITEGIVGTGSIHPHRLRHTFATSLMNADLHPLVVMMLLGHKDLRMTARYSLITNGTVYRNFFEAVNKSKFNVDFNIPDVVPISGEFDPCAAIDGVTKWLQRREDHSEREVALIIKRLNRLRSEIGEME